MSTTSLKLSDELKRRAVGAAQQLGVSPHAFMLSAIEQATGAAEQRALFLKEAHAARDTLMETGKGFAADEVHAYLKSRISGVKLPEPKAGSWRD